MKKFLVVVCLFLYASACGGASETVAPTTTNASASTTTTTASTTPQTTSTRTLTAQEIINKSKTVMYQLSEYWYMDEVIVKSSNFEFKITEIGNFQSPDKTAGSVKGPGESLSFIAIGKTCYWAEDKPGEQEWSELDCSEDFFFYEYFFPTNNSVLDLGITATPELIESDGNRPTAYFIDNGGSTDLSNIEGTNVWAEYFLGDDGPGIPERFRIQYWINVENFRLQTLVLSFYIASEAVENPESFGLGEGDFLEVIFVLEFRPLGEKVPEIKPPVITATAAPTPAPAATAPPTATASSTEEVAEIKFSAVPLFVAVGEQGTILTSSDGTTWTAQISETSNNLGNVIYKNSTFMAVGRDGTILTSSDGTDWTTRASGTIKNLWGVTYGNNTWVTNGDDGTILTSSNGTDWTTRTSGVTEEFNEVIYGNSTFVAFGNSATILTSLDGIDWFYRIVGIPFNLSAGTYGNGTFVAVGRDGNIITSSDAVTWTSRTSGTSVNFRRVIYKE